MAFEFLKKRKKYPFNKKNPPAAVYAGPEYFARRSGRKDDADVEIYAGPEYYEGRLPPKDGGEEDAPLPPEEAPVYAGPEPREARGGRIYAGPEKPEKPALLVYAGPEFFQRRKAEKDDIAALASGVYAGPEPPRGGMMGAPEDGPADGEA